MEGGFNENPLRNERVALTAYTIDFEDITELTDAQLKLLCQKNPEFNFEFTPLKVLVITPKTGGEAGKQNINKARKKSPYLSPGRLADVLALIQVLALDEHHHRSNDGLSGELLEPKSTTSWKKIASEHPEFFRVKNPHELTPNSPGHDTSLVACHVLPKDETLPSEYTSTLLRIAIDLHDKAVSRSQSWHVWLPILGVILGGLLPLCGILLTNHLNSRSNTPLPNTSSLSSQTNSMIP